jgi:hypothetical protein
MMRPLAAVAVTIALLCSTPAAADDSAGIDVALRNRPVTVRQADIRGITFSGIAGVSAPAYLTLSRLATGDTALLDGPYGVAGNTVVQRTQALGATVDLSIAAAQRLELSAVVTAPPGDQGWRLVLHLPLASGAWQWAAGPNTALAFGAGPDPTEAALYPFTALVSERHGIALATPLDAPVMTRFSRNGNELIWSFTLGTSDLTRPIPNQANVRMQLWRMPPRWGFRQLLADAYVQYPERFKRQHERVGLWSVGTPRGVIDPAPFLFHEHGNVFFDSTDSSARPLAEQVPLDDAYGWSVFPYLHVGQMSRTRLAGLPDGAASIDTYLATQAVTFPPQHVQRYTELGLGPADYEAALLASRAEDAARQPLANIRRTFTNAYDPDTGRLVRRWDTMGNQVSFFVNAAPRLELSGVPGHGRRMLAWARALLEAHPMVGGIYADATIGWAQEGNFRRSHFRSTRLPLASDAQGRAYLPGAWGHYEFFDALRGLLQSRGKLLFANGYGSAAKDVTTFFHGTLPHVFGTERLGSDVTNYLARSMAGPRLILSNTKEVNTAQDVARHIRSSLALGILPSARASYFARPRWVNRDEQFATGKGMPRYEEDRAEWETVYRVMESLGRAEWQPIPHATSADPGIRIERFRAAQQVLWTVYRTADGPATAIVSVDARLDLEPLAVDLMTGQSLAVHAIGDVLRVTVPGVGQAGDLAIISIERR